VRRTQPSTAHKNGVAPEGAAGAAALNNGLSTDLTMLVKTPTGPEVGAAATVVVTIAVAAAAVAAEAEGTTEDATELLIGPTVTAVGGAATAAVEDTRAVEAVLFIAAVVAFIAVAATALAGDDGNDGNDGNDTDDLEADFDCAAVEVAPADELDAVPVLETAPADELGAVPVLEPAPAPPADDSSLAPLTPVAGRLPESEPPLLAPIGACAVAVSWPGGVVLEGFFAVDGWGLVGVFCSVWAFDFGDEDAPLDIDELFDELPAVPGSAWACTTPNPVAAAVKSQAPAARPPYRPARVSVGGFGPAARRAARAWCRAARRRWAREP